MIERNILLEDEDGHKGRGMTDWLTVSCPRASCRHIMSSLELYEAPPSASSIGLQ